MSLRSNQKFNKMTLSEQKYRLEELICKGEDIELAVDEHHGAEALKVFTAWIGEVRIFTERYLKNHHPMYQTLHKACFLVNVTVHRVSSLLERYEQWPRMQNISEKKGGALWLV